MHIVLFTGVSGRSFLQSTVAPTARRMAKPGHRRSALAAFDKHLQPAGPHTDHDKSSFASWQVAVFGHHAPLPEFSPTWSLENSSFTILQDHFSCGCFTVAGIHPLLCPRCPSKLLRLDVAIDCCLQGTPSRHCPQRVAAEADTGESGDRDYSPTLLCSFLFRCSPVLRL